MKFRSHDGVLASRTPDPALSIRQPTATDGAAVHALISQCAPLDENSMYCNLLQCTHFAKTSALATAGNSVFGFVSGYLVPESPEELFIWQVAVAPNARGRSIGRRMVENILARPACQAVSELYTSITPDNAASQALFASLAKRLDAPVNKRILFDITRHFDGEHESEELWMIGPFGAGHVTASDVLTYPLAS